MEAHNKVDAMTQVKIITIIGARPQFIKAAMTSKALSEHPDFNEIIIHTGQHYDANMSEIFFTELGIPVPQINLDINGGGHGEMTAKMLAELEKVMITEKPDAVLLFGDTNSTLAAALAASKLHIPIAHVEAGLRSFNKKMPEEINRILTDHCSEWLFAPTASAVENLNKENIEESKIFKVGDVMYDAAISFSRVAGSPEFEALKRSDYVLATVHRQENTDDPERLAAIIDGLNDVAEKIDVILPLHPRTRKILGDERLSKLSPNFKIIAPIGYFDMLGFQRNAKAIATDSGGVQKEAYFSAVPCITLRDETEWVELIESGWNRLVKPTSKEAVFEGIIEAIGTRGDDVELYGIGNSAKEIVEHMHKRLVTQG